MFGAYCISTYFIDIHADAAEGLQVSYLAEHNCEGEFMEVCPPALKEDMYMFNYQAHKWANDHFVMLFLILVYS